MPDQDKVLSQNEVDALLSAIDSGEVEVGVDETPALQATPYDFKRPERVARDQLNAIGALHEVLARSMQTTFAGLLRTVVDVEVASVDQLTFSEFINSLPNPTVFNVMTVEPLEGNFILEINPTIAFPVIERLLGSRLVGSVQPERELTPIEWNLIDRITDRAVELLKTAWAKVADLEFKLTSKVSNPQLMQIMSPNEPVIMVVLEMSMGENKGYMNLCIPVLSIEPLMDGISTHTWFATRRKDAAQGQETAIVGTVNQAEMEAVVHLPVEAIMLSRLRNLSPGDFIVTNHLQKDPVILSVEGHPKFRVRLGSFRNRLAGCVERPVEEEEVFKVVQPSGAVDVVKGGEAEGVEARPADLEAAVGSQKDGAIEGLLRLPVDLGVALSEKTVHLKEVLQWKPGDILDFEKRIEEPLQLLAGGRPIAKGMTVKVGEKFGLQIAQIGEPKETLQSLGPM